MAVICTVADRHLYTANSNGFLSSADSYSISVWINAVWNSGTTLSFVGMYDGGLTTPAPTTGLQIGTRGGVNGDVTCWTYGGTILVQSTGTMISYNNIWTLMTYTFDGTTHRIYRNDVLLATSTTAIVPGVFTQVYINGYPPTGTTNECSTHQVDAYSYYGRTLSLPEIQTIYNATGSRHGIVDKLIARYDFDELSQGSTVVSCVDLTGNNNTLLNTGAGAAITYTYTGTTANSNLRPVQ